MLPSRALENAEQTQLLFPQWVVVRYLASMVPWPCPADAALVYYRDIALPAVERGDAWHWTRRLKSDPARIIGAIGLMRGEKENRGFWLAPLWHGQGLMSEASDAATDYWFDRLGFLYCEFPKRRRTWLRGVFPNAAGCAWWARKSATMYAGGYLQRFGRLPLRNGLTGGRAMRPSDSRLRRLRSRGYRLHSAGWPQSIRMPR